MCTVGRMGESRAVGGVGVSGAVVVSCWVCVIGVVTSESVDNWGVAWAVVGCCGLLADV